MRRRFWLGLALAALVTSPSLAQTADRIEGWRGDIAVVRDQFLPADLSFSDAARAAARERLARLEADLPHLSDQQIVAQFAMVAALSENAHTRAYLLRNRGWWRRYPIRMWRFADGWRVVSAQPGYEALLGVRVARIAGRAIEDVQRAVRPLFPGNDAWADYMATYSLTSPDALLGVGVTQSDVVTFEGVGEGGAVSMQVAPAPFVRRDTAEENWWFLAPAHPANAGWRHALEGASTPAFLEAPGENYLVRRCRGDVLYVQFFRAENEGQTESVRQFGERLLAEIAANPPRKLIIDLRFNTGGSLDLAQPFFAALAQTPLGQRRGALYAISGGATFSAGQSALAQLRQDTRVTIVGEGPGDVLDYWSEGGRVELPYSGILMRYTNRAHTYSRAEHNVPPEQLWLNYDVDSLEPDRRTRWRWRDYAAGRDPSLEAIVGRRADCGAPIGV